MRRVFKTAVSVIATLALAVTLCAGISAPSAEVYADTNLVSNGTWSFYAANYSWRAPVDPYNEATLTSLSTDSESIDVSFTTYQTGEVGQQWGDLINFSEPLEVTAAQPSYGFNANIKSTGWAGDYSGDVLVGDAPYTLTGKVTVPVEEGKIYSIDLDILAQCKDEANANVNKMITVNIEDSEGTVLDTQKITTTYGQNYAYHMEMASSASTTLSVVVCYGSHIFSNEAANIKGSVVVSNASVTYLSDDDQYIQGPGVEPATKPQATTKPQVTTKPQAKPQATTKPQVTTKAKKPAKVKGVKASNKKGKKIKISWKKASRAKKYQIKIGSKVVKTTKKLKYTAKVKKKKTYKVYVRAINSAGKGKWSKVVKVKVKK